MADHEVFTWSPLLDSTSGTTEYRVRTASFGDGYRQEVADGINSYRDTWSLEFRDSSEVLTQIKAFLDRHLGYKAFTWTPPLGEPSLFKVKSRGLKPLGNGVYSITATFEQEHQA